MQINEFLELLANGELDQATKNAITISNGDPALRQILLNLLALIKNETFNVFSIPDLLKEKQYQNQLEYVIALQTQFYYWWNYLPGTSSSYGYDIGLTISNAKQSEDKFGLDKYWLIILYRLNAIISICYPHHFTGGTQRSFWKSLTINVEEQSLDKIISNAIFYYQQSLDLTSKVKYPAILDPILAKLDLKLINEGKNEYKFKLLDQLIEYTNKQDTQLYLAKLLQIKSKILNNDNRLVQALQNSEHAFSIYKEYSQEKHLSNVLLQLVKISVEMDSVNEANKWVEELHKLTNISDDINLQTLYEFSKGLLLSSSSRLVKKAEGINIFQTIVDNVNTDEDIALDAMIYLAKLLLYELKASNDKDVFDELRHLIDKIYKLGQHKRSPSIIIDNLLLRANIAIINGEFDEVEHFYFQAEFMAEENRMQLYMVQISDQLSTFRADYENWLDNLKNTSLNERIEKSNLEQYINHVKNLSNLD